MELRRFGLATLLSTAPGSILIAAETPAQSAANWAQWRGPLHTGEAPRGNPPLEWSEGKNIKWKVEVPGLGKSTPVVWGNLVFVTTAVPTGKAVPAQTPQAGPASGSRRGGPPPGEKPVHLQFVVQAHNRADGRVAWRKVVNEQTPHEGTHKDGTFASGSALTDGERVYAFFGSRGLYALDLKGKVVWEKQLGTMQTRLSFGEGASPVLHGDRLVVNWDHEGPDFVVALDKKTGKELWRTERNEPTSWATPIVVTHHGKEQVIINATKRVSSYELATGKLLWEAAGMTENVIPSPVHADGTVYLTSGFRGNALLAVRLDEAQGDITGKPAIAWSYDRDTPYVPSPLIYRGGLYFLKTNSAVLTRIDVATGKPTFTQRLEGLSNVYASPVAVDGRIYVLSREGVMMVLEAGPELKVLAKNTLNDGFDASPAIVGNEMYLRGQKYLYRISKD